MIEIFVYRVRGLSPLMQSNPECFITDEPDTALKTKKQDYNSDAEAAMRCYPKGGLTWPEGNDDGVVTATGPFLHPAAAFRSAMCKAAVGRKIAKRAARMVVAGAVFPVDEFVTIEDDEGEPAEYVLDKRSVVVQKARILRVRPKFTPWECDLKLEVDRDFIGEKVLTEILNLAGRIIGIGEFRPDPSDGKSGIGTFGRFNVEFIRNVK